MMQTNTLPQQLRTHEGAVAPHINPEQQLRRSVMATLLFENTFYEDGIEISERIKSLIAKVPAEKVFNIAIEARTKAKLRHVPLLIARQMAGLPSHKHLVAKLLPKIMLRADEPAEFMALYWKNGRQPVSAQVKKGLAAALANFTEYELAKYNRDRTVKLRDVLFLSHSKPKDARQAKYTRLERKQERKLGATPKLSEGERLYRKLIDGQLQTPNTWEVALSTGADKKATFERLMNEGELGALAFLRNLRNMDEAGVKHSLIESYAEKVKTDKVLPFRFVAAARVVPIFEPLLEQMMFRCLEGQEKLLLGKTVIVIDNSGSMYNHSVSAMSDMDRSDAACALAILIRELCDDAVVISFSEVPRAVPSRRGFALRDAIKSATDHSATKTDDALALAESYGYDRIIVVTDEQSHQSVRAPKGKGYFINVGNYRNGIGYGAWVHIDGWSEKVIDFIREHEKDGQWLP